MLGPSGETLPFLLLPYYKNAALWTCPQDRRAASKYHGTASDISVSYGYNWLCLAPDGQGIRLADVGTPDATVVFVDSTSYRAIPSPLVGRYSGTAPEYRHARGANVGWADGHVSYVAAQLEATGSREKGKPLGSGIDAFLSWNRR